MLAEVDLIVDLGAPNFEPYGTFSGALITALRRLGDLNRFRNFVLDGHRNSGDVQGCCQGRISCRVTTGYFSRRFSSRLPTGIRRPNYGDYTIVHPEFTPADMRKIKSAGKLVYTTGKSWEVRKGGAFRDNAGQMHGHCA